MDKKEIILSLIDTFANGNKAQFARLLGISPQSVSTWIARNSFDYDLVYAKCEGVSADYLLSGVGPVIKDKTSNFSDSKIPIAFHSDNNHGIPLIPFSAMAGALNGEMTALEYECERYVVPAFNGADFLMPIKGDSMLPTYQSGDIVACKRIPLTDLFFQWNKPYILDTNQGPIIKRINPGSDQEHIQIVSDNPKYKPFELRYTDIHSVAQVIGIIRLE